MPMSLTIGGGSSHWASTSVCVPFRHIMNWAVWSAFAIRLNSKKAVTPSTALLYNQRLALGFT